MAAKNSKALPTQPSAHSPIRYTSTFRPRAGELLSCAESCPQRGLLFQVRGPVRNQGERLGDRLLKNGIDHESLAVGGSGVGSRGTTHSGGFEQGMGRAHFASGTYFQLASIQILDEAAMR